MIKDILFYPDPMYRPSPKPVGIPTSESLELNIDFEENSLFQEGVISESFSAPQWESNLMPLTLQVSGLTARPQR